MKTKLILFSISMMLTFYSDAQVQPHAIGVRGGPGTYGYGGEVSYQHGFGSSNRLELDLGWRGSNSSHYSAIGIAGIYHWVWNIDGGLNWFVGPGALIGIYSHRHHNHNHVHNSDFVESGIHMAVGGQIGLDYDFNEHGIPFQLGLDVRPMFGLFENYGYGLGFGGALSLRYTF